MVKVYRKFKKQEENLEGVLIDFNPKFILIQELNQFDLDGFALFSRDDFDSIRYNKFDKAITKILKGEGVYKAQYGIPYKIYLKNWKTIFESLKQQDIHAIVECDRMKTPSFTIGPVVKVSKKSVWILYYNATGKLDKKPTKIPFKDITTLRFGDRYSTTFRKYLR